MSEKCLCVFRRHTLSRRRIIPLPQWKANPETDPEALFSKDQLVLALYPQTTCFYRALIHTPPHRVRLTHITDLWWRHRHRVKCLSLLWLSQTDLSLCLQPQDDYSVLFEDTSYADGYSPPLNVAQRYVVACKENKKKWAATGGTNMEGSFLYENMFRDICQICRIL